MGNWASGEVSVPASRGNKPVSTSIAVKLELQRLQQPGVCLVPFPHSQVAPHQPFHYAKKLLVGLHGKAAKLWSGLKKSPVPQRAHLWDSGDSKLQPDFGTRGQEQHFLSHLCCWSQCITSASTLIQPSIQRKRAIRAEAGRICRLITMVLWEHRGSEWTREQATLSRCQRQLDFSRNLDDYVSCSTISLSKAGKDGTWLFFFSDFHSQVFSQHKAQN